MTVSRVAAALHACKAVGGPWMPCDARGDCDCRPMAKHLIGTLADDGYTIVSQVEWMDRADPTLAADLALAAAVREHYEDIVDCVQACADDPREPERYRAWYHEALAAIQDAIEDEE